mgnify:CR=1 FL=1|tara:strand:- start:78 stop:467 length:390 start_codon:yes stop_codon:yes gene_type:complete
MNTRKTVYEKLFRNDETKLAKHEVELGLAQDIKSAVDATLLYKEKRAAAWNKASTPLIGLYDILKMEYQSALTASKGIEDLKEKTKTLGIDMPPKMLENEKVINEIVKLSKSKFDQLNKIINSIPTLVL